MSDAILFVLLVGICVLGCAVATGSRTQRRVGIGVALLALGVPWLAPRGHFLVRAVLAILAFCGGMRAIDLRVRRWSLLERLAHAVSFVDTRKLVRDTPRLETAALARFAAWEAVGAAAFLLVIRVGPVTSGLAYWAIRWGVGLAALYALTEATYCLVFVAYRLAGFRPPPLHLHPGASRSVQEFWGKRWNLTVSAWLGETFFWPLARRGRPLAGVLMAFFVSALLHAYIGAAAMGWWMAVAMLGYFVIQGLVVGMERALGVAQWKTVPAHLWTLAWMVGLSPVFTESLLRTMRL